MTKARDLADYTGLQGDLAGKVDDSQVLTNVPSGAVFTDTTYTVGDSGLTQNNFTNTLKTKLDSITVGATNYTHPANHAISVISGLQAALDAKTTETYVNAAVAAIVDSSPAALNTLNELAAALGDDANFSTTTATALGLRVAKDSATGAASMPTGTTAQRPTGALGMFRHNTTLNQFEGYNDGAWGALAGGDEVSFVTYEYIATAGQTTFSGADSNSLTLAYTAANIIVSYGGQDLPHSDYTATNGTSVVLDDGAVVGEIVRIVAFTAFTVADTYTQAQIDSKDATKLPLAGGTMTGDTGHADNVKAKFGASDDLQIYHDGGHSRIKDVGTGNLVLAASTSVNIDGNNGTNIAHFYESGVSRFYGNVGIGVEPANPLHVTKEIAGYQAYFNNDNGSAQGLKVRVKANDSGNFNILDLVSASTGSDVSVMKVRDDGNVGIGVTPETWQSGWSALQIGAGLTIGGYGSGNPSHHWINANAYQAASDATEKYIGADQASQLKQTNGTFAFNVAPNGTADAAISWTTAMTIGNNSGRVVDHWQLAVGNDGYYKLPITGQPRMVN